MYQKLKFLIQGLTHNKMGENGFFLYYFSDDLNVFAEKFSLIKSGKKYLFS